LGISECGVAGLPFADNSIFKISNQTESRFRCGNNFNFNLGNTIMKNTKIIIAILALILLAATAFGQEEPTPTPTPEETPTSDVTTQTSDAPQSEPKKEGVIRIGLVKSKMQMGANNPTGEDAGEAVRQIFASLLVGPTVETVSIEARIPSQINIEAEQKGCNFVLYTSLSKKSKTGIFGSLISAVVPVLTNQIPKGENVDPNGSDVNTTQQTVNQAGTDIANNLIAAKTSAKDVITLDFNLVAVGGTASALKNSLKAKAKSDGEDVLLPLIEQAAGEVLQAAMKK
jgi:hypothetical protein